MNDIPTPEADACYHHCVTHPGPGNGIVMRAKMRELERRLTMARDALTVIQVSLRTYGMPNASLEFIAKTALKATETSGREE